MAIQITKGAKKEVGELGKLKADLATHLESIGLPSTCYVVVLTKQPTPVWLKENNVTTYGEAKPIIGVKKGSIMYNMQGKGHINGEDTALRGNVFLSNMTVDEETRAAYADAKEAKAESFERSKLAKQGLSEAEIEAALQAARDEAGETA